MFFFCVGGRDKNISGLLHFYQLVKTRVPSAICLGNRSVSCLIFFSSSGGEKFAAKRGMPKNEKEKGRKGERRKSSLF